jgi:hypothetical protein
MKTPTLGGKNAASMNVSTLQPALASIPNACRYLGDLSRSRIYELLPRLEIVKIGNRTFVTVASLDRLIADSLRPAAAPRGGWQIP